MRKKQRLFLLGSALLLGCSANNILDTKDALGSIVLNIRGDFSALKTQAVISDISTLSVRVQARDLAVQSHDFSAYELGQASPSVRFDGLRTGLATVSVRILNAASQQIGMATSTASVAKDVLTPVSLSVQLNPTYVEAGNIGLDLSIGEGDEVLAPQGGDQ
jgi:hypothetical protein